jgi:hypothetical protein
MGNYHDTDRFYGEDDYDAMVDDYLTGDSPYPVTNRQVREEDAARDHWEREQRFARW